MIKKLIKKIGKALKNNKKIKMEGIDEEKSNIQKWKFKDGRA